MKEQFPEKKAAIFSTWQDNRTKLIGEGLEQTGRLKVDFSFDGLELDTVNFPHDEMTTYIQKIDEKIAEEASFRIKEEGPDLNWVYLQFTDNTGHKYGDSPQNDQAVEIIDRQVGQIYNAVKYREQLCHEKWVVFVTTDHGRESIRRLTPWWPDRGRKPYGSVLTSHSSTSILMPVDLLLWIYFPVWRILFK